MALSNAGSNTGSIPYVKSNLPPYFFGIFSGSMYSSRLEVRVEEESMKILDTVIGSNHFLIQPHTVGKKDGAPMI